MVKIICKDIITLILSVLVISGNVGMTIYHSKPHCSTSPPKQSIECKFLFCESAVSFTYEYLKNSEYSVICPWEKGTTITSFVSIFIAVMHLILYVSTLCGKDLSSSKNILTFVGGMGLLANLITVVVMCVDIKKSSEYMGYYSNKFTLHHTSYIISAVLMFVLFWISFWDVYMIDDVHSWKRSRAERGGGRSMIRAIITRVTRSQPQPEPLPQTQPQQQIVIQAENPQGGTELSEDNSNMDLNGNGVGEEELEQ